MLTNTLLLNTRNKRGLIMNKLVSLRTCAKLLGIHPVQLSRWVKTDARGNGVRSSILYAHLYFLVCTKLFGQRFGRVECEGLIYSVGAKRRKMLAPTFFTFCLRWLSKLYGAKATIILRQIIPPVQHLSSWLLAMLF